MANLISTNNHNKHEFYDIYLIFQCIRNIHIKTKENILKKLD